MTYASTEQRTRLIAGLRALAEFLETVPEAPAPVTADLMVFPGGTNTEKRAEIDAIATRIGAQTRWTICDHYTVSRHFGPVEYRATAIPDNDSGSE
jgi:hypothetical protein